jgi:hypothetical protein
MGIDLLQALQFSAKGMDPRACQFTPGDVPGIYGQYDPLVYGNNVPGIYGQYDPPFYGQMYHLVPKGETHIKERMMQ